MSVSNEELLTRYREQSANLRAELATVRGANTDANGHIGELSNELTRAHANAASFRAHHLAEMSRLTKELLELRADAKALASIVEGVSKQKWNMGVAAELAHSALATLNAREALTTTQSNPAIEAYRALCLEIDGIKATLAGARADNVRLRAALLKQAHEPEGELCWCHTPVCTNQPACKEAREALATPAPVVPKPYDWPEDFSHENGNYMSECVLCHQEFIGHKRRTICKLCAHAVVPIADSEALAAALNDAMIALPHSIDRGVARDALSAYRTRHPAPKEPPP